MYGLHMVSIGQDSFTPQLDLFGRSLEIFGWNMLSGKQQHHVVEADALPACRHAQLNYQ